MIESVLSYFIIPSKDQTNHYKKGQKNFSQFKNISNLNLNITSNYDGTAGGNTVTQTAGGLLTTGRAFFYGATTDPRTGYYGSQIDTRYEYYQVTGGQAFDSTGPGLTRPFSAGDVWMQRE